MKLKNVLFAAAITAGQLAIFIGYDRFVVRPRTAIATVNVAAVFLLKEQQFAKEMIAAKDDAGRERAMRVATAFAERYPAALEELALECSCLLVDRSVVVGTGRALPDFTDRLKAKVL